MHKFVIAGLAIAIAWPVAVQAANNPAFSAVQNMVSAYSNVQTVRVVEHFENGAVATVDIMPSGQFRVASTGNQDPALIVKIATQPADGAASTGTYTINSLGNKTVDGVHTSGYKIASPDGTYTAWVWVDARNLPIAARVQTQGHTIDVEFGDYNSLPSVATH